MAKVDKLKKLIENLGGECPATDNISDCLDALCGCEIGGGGGASTVYVTINSDLSTDLSSTDIKAYVDQGVYVVAKYKNAEGLNSYAPLIYSGAEAVFGGFVWENRDFNPIQILIFENKAEIKKEAVNVLFPDDHLYLYSSGMNSYCEIIVEADGTVKGVKTDKEPTELS